MRHLAAVPDHGSDEQQHRHREMSCCRRQNTADVVVPEDLALLKQYEEDVRFEIDARTAATEAAGRTLGLTRLFRELDLDDAHRKTLLLALNLRLGTLATDSLERVGTYALTGAIAAEVVAAFCLFDCGDRLRRLRFWTERKLVKAVLIKYDTADDADPGDWSHASVKLTGKEFTDLTGLQAAGFGRALAVEFDRVGVLHDVRSSLRVASWSYSQAPTVGSRLWVASKAGLVPLDPKWTSLPGMAA